LQGFNDHLRVVIVKDMRTGRDMHILKRDYRELLPLLRYRYRRSQKKVQEILNRDRNVHLTVDIQLQQRVAQILEQHVSKAGSQKGAAIVLDPKTGELLASATYPWAGVEQISVPPMETDQTMESNLEALIDRPRYGIYSPGSSFKLVTAVAALRKDNTSPARTFTCIRLPDGRVGNYVRGLNRPVRDDILDKAPHGTVNLERGLTVSCNAFFAQLGTYVVGPDELLRTASFFNIKVASPNEAKRLRQFMPWASYGQGEVVVTPLQMARVAATVANEGRVVYPWWVREEAPTLNVPVQSLLSPSEARMLSRFMREVVTGGTGRALAGLSVPVAGKTGTAEMENQPSHAWFIGYAPYGSSARQIAFAVLVENGSYGGRVAAPAAGEIILAAAERGLFGNREAAESASRQAGKPAGR
jgi:peptidoglycan glycosyltransferase